MIFLVCSPMEIQLCTGIWGQLLSVDNFLFAPSFDNCEQELCTAGGGGGWAAWDVQYDRLVARTCLQLSSLYLGSRDRLYGAPEPTAQVGALCASPFLQYIKSWNERNEKRMSMVRKLHIILKVGEIGCETKFSQFCITNSKDLCSFNFKPFFIKLNIYRTKIFHVEIVYNSELVHLGILVLSVVDLDPVGPSGSFIILYRIRILPLTSKKSKENFDLYSRYFVTSFWLSIYENWCKCTLQK